MRKEYKFEYVDLFKSIILLFYILPYHSFSNNIIVSNTRLANQNTIQKFTSVQFDLSWENSWKVDSNWDAAWVFVKFQVGVVDPVFYGVSSSGNTVTVSSTVNLRVGMPVRVTGGIGAFAVNTVITSITGPTTFTVSAVPTTPLSAATIDCTRIWEHATLNTMSGTHAIPAGSTLDVSSDGKGAFVYRDSPGIGNVNFNDIMLRWEYGTDGVEDNRLVNIKVYAIEMVYVGQGEFAVGSGNSAENEFVLTTINTAIANAAPSGTGSLGGQAGGYPTGETAPNAAWPNGFNAYYIMKYEMSQQQYVDFLNTLTRVQQDTRTEVELNEGISSTSFVYVMTYTENVYQRNSIRIDNNFSEFKPLFFYCDLNDNGVSEESNDGKWIAMNFISFMDGAAYLDWSGLRLMTELEFEKAARGPKVPVLDEYAWGTASIASSLYTLTNSGSENEGIASNYSSNSINGNAFYSTTSGSISGVIGGPLRVGIFSSHFSNSSRASAGASYWGVMELSGNLEEPAVTIDHVLGRSFTGFHGDGKLSVNGNANVADFPGIFESDGEVIYPDGSGYRGGNWASNNSALRVSNRIGASNPNMVRIHTRGFRGVRTAP